jgi:S1-C subfamily serine protease
MKSAAKLLLALATVAVLGISSTTVDAATWAQATLGIDCFETSGNGRYTGVYVSRARYGMAAADAGIEQGDIIAYVNGVRVRTYDDLQTAISDDPDGVVVVHVDNVRRPGTLGRTVLRLPW